MSFLDERFRSLLKNIFGSAAARGINLLITLMLVPLTVNALDSTDYAYLATAISLSMLTAYADLGMGLAVINVIARKKEGETDLRAQRAVSVVWIALVWIAIAGLLLTAVVAVVLNFSQSEESLRQYNALLLASACVFAGLPSGLVQRILFAEQRNIEANAWATSGKLLSLSVVYFLVRSDSADLLSLVVSILGIPMLVNWCSSIHLFLIRKSMLRPKKSLFVAKLLKKYASLGIGYLILNLVPYAETGADALLLTSMGYGQLVQTYDVHAKMFAYITAFASIVAFPLWPAIANAKAKRDLLWIAKLERISYLAVTASAMFISYIFVVYGQVIVETWVGKSLVVENWMLFAFGFYAILSSVSVIQAMFLNALGEINGQVHFYVRYLPVLVIAKALVLGFLGVAMMLWVFNIFCVFRLVYFFRKTNSSIEAPCE